jgi:hypothetical protein
MNKIKKIVWAQKEIIQINKWIFANRFGFLVFYHIVGILMKYVMSGEFHCQPSAETTFQAMVYESYDRYNEQLTNRESE